MTETLHKAAHSTLAFLCLQRKSKVKHKLFARYPLLILINVKSNIRKVLGMQVAAPIYNINLLHITP